MRGRKGFTLTEIIVALIILGVLTTMAVRTGQDYIEKMRSAEAIEILSKCYAGYLRLLYDGESVSAANPLKWSRLGMTNPNLNANRFFDYSILNSDSDPVWMYADRIGRSFWLRINMASGNISKTAPY